MIPISDSIYASVPLPLDTKLSNLRQSGPNTIVEGIVEYLERVTIDSRYLGMIVPIVYPEGTYENSVFKSMVENREVNVSLYAFIVGIQDEDFLPWCPTCDPPIIQTRWVAISSTCQLDDTGFKTGIVETLEKEQKKVDDGPWTDTGQTRITTSYNPTICPLPKTRTVEISRECLLNTEENVNTGYLKIIFNIEQQKSDGNWVVISENQENIIYDAGACPLPIETADYKWVETSQECVKVGGYNNTTLRTYRKEQKSTDGINWIDTGNTDYVDTSDAMSCPLPQYRWTTTSTNCETSGGYNTGNLLTNQIQEISLDSGNTWTSTGQTRTLSETNTGTCPVIPFGVWVSIDVELDGAYNSSIEISYTYSPGTEISIQNPITSTDDYHYLFISYPTGKDFELYEGGGNKITVVSVGADNRNGYRNNTLYKYEECFTTDSAVKFKLKML